LERAKYIWASFLASTYRKEWIRRQYQSVRSNSSLMNDILPTWDRQLYLTTSIATLDVLADVARRLKTMQRGDALIAHIMLPHSPFSVDGACNIRTNATSWLWSTNFTLSDGRKNTPESRLARYKLYFEQMRCLMGKLEALIVMIDSSPILRDATVIIHGDHGARIQLHIPSQKNYQFLTTSDLRDTYSTLFAVRDTAKIPMYVQRPVKIQEGLAKSVGASVKNVGLADELMVNPIDSDAGFIRVPRSLLDGDTDLSQSIPKDSLQ
jgi:hypothetical protein